MLAKIPHSISVEAHNNYWNILAEPSEKFQNPPAIPISMPHQQIHQLGNVHILQ
jgi:hypothetical protein